MNAGKWYIEASNNYQQLKKLREKMIRGGNNCGGIMESGEETVYRWYFRYQRESASTAYQVRAGLPEEYMK